MFKYKNYLRCDSENTDLFIWGNKSKNSSAN